ncbi:LAFE_0G14488g1_1 [Lachancea fermentati]|uniref:BRO domain-containing protein 1 n=1 Tax=Lachancea fermentati TaxID=4955 RepID=A0A1G4MIB7_LACFM|nr:LAFE_0G14488g1_1 [Lachancea fermentati]
MKTFLLSLKVRDTEKLSWSKGLSSYLKRSYGSSAWNQFFDSQLADEFDRSRSNANGELAPESLLEQNYKYYAYLEQLYLRLGNNSNQLRLDFTWYDAEYSSRSESQKYTQHTLAFEKSSTIYNIGVLLTQVASEKLNGDYKTATSNLSKAYGCFEYLSENFLNSPSVDLQAENTKFLADICHAQAQELFLLKLINGPDVSKHASLISKLAAMTFVLYEKCAKFYESGDESATSLVPYGELKWKSIITCKQHLYKSISALNYGIALEQQSKPGEAIAFLQIANAAILSALPHKLYVKDVIDLEQIKTMIEDKLKSLVKDNDFIYHETIPSDVKFEAIKTMDAIKSQDITKQTERYMDSVNDSCNILFKGIVPMDVYEKESIYSEEKAIMLRKELDVVETANWEFTSFIEFTNLPKLVDDLKIRYKDGVNGSQGEDPQLSMMKEQIDSWSTNVRRSPYKNVKEQLNKIVEKRNEIMGLLNSIPDDDNNKDNVLKLKSSLIAASQSDEKLFSFVNPYLEEMNLLDNPELLHRNWEQLISTPESQPSLLDLDDSKNEEIMSKIKHVSEQYENLRLLKEERSRNVQDLKEEVNNDDITKTLIVNRGKPESALKEVFQTELDKFKPLSTRIEATVFKQTNIINDIKLSLDDIFKMTDVHEKSSEGEAKKNQRNAFYQKLNNAFTNFSIFSGDLPKGLKFYDSLLQMTRDLAKSSSSSTPRSSAQENPLPPVLPSQSNPSQNVSLDERFRQLSVASNVSPGSSFSAPGGTPQLPPRTYDDGNGSLNPSTSNGPPVPPKQPSHGIASLLSNQQQRQSENQEFEQNPTSFYNNPSVFNENMYSNFGG